VKSKEKLDIGNVSAKHFIGMVKTIFQEMPL
jgi:hypothetical protein